MTALPEEGRTPNINQPTVQESFEQFTETLVRATSVKAQQLGIDTVPVGFIEILKKAVNEVCIAAADSLSTAMLSFVKEGPGNSSSTEEDAQVSCLSWNLENFSSVEELEVVLQIIRDSNADFCLVQNTTEAVFEHLQMEVANDGMQCLSSLAGVRYDVIIYRMSRFVLLQSFLLSIENLLLEQALSAGIKVGSDLKESMKTDDLFHVGIFWDKTSRKKLTILNVFMNCTDTRLDLLVAQVCSVIKFVEPSTSPFIIAGHLGVTSNDVGYNAMLTGKLKECERKHLAKWNVFPGSGLNPLVSYYPAAFTHDVESLESCYKKLQGCESVAYWEPTSKCHTEKEYILHNALFTSLCTIVGRKSEEEELVGANLYLYAKFTYSKSESQ